MHQVLTIIYQKAAQLEDLCELPASNEGVGSQHCHSSFPQIVRTCQSLQYGTVPALQRRCSPTIIQRLAGWRGVSGRRSLIRPHERERTFPRVGDRDLKLHVRVGRQRLVPGMTAFGVLVKNSRGAGQEYLLAALPILLCGVGVRGVRSQRCPQRLLLEAFPLRAVSPTGPGARPSKGQAYLTASISSKARYP